MACVISSISMKGGVGKTTSLLCLGAGLADRGKKVLMLDLDAQGSLSIAMGCEYPDRCPVAMAEIFQSIKDTQGSIEAERGILSVSENLDYIPANRKMALVEQELSLTEEGERLLLKILPVLSGCGKAYDYILLDCPPSLGMVTMNALVASDWVLIPTQTKYLAAKGREMLLQTVVQIRRKWNGNLKILGILPTMVNLHTLDAKQILKLLTDTYGESIGILPVIPYSVRAKEISSQRKSIYRLDKGGKVAAAYLALVSEVLQKTETDAGAGGMAG